MHTVLALIILQFGSALKANTESYERGDQSQDEWYAEFLRLLALYLMLAWMQGARATDLNDVAQQSIEDTLDAQKQYLDGFRETIDTLTPDEAVARSELYASSATPLYWKALGGQLVLPAYPGDGSSECGQFCKCAWRLVWLS